MNPKADVLVVTATKIESDSVFRVFKRAGGHKPKPQSIDDRVYFDLGSINGAQVWMTQCEMGSGGLDASLLAVQKGIDSLSPVAVIMVGIAFGIDEKKQAMGDILVTEKLHLYDLQRVGTEDGNPRIILRGDRPHASPWLLNHLKSAELEWEGAKVRFGVMLSGEKLVDNMDFREQLCIFGPEAIGGEMEGAGLYVACQDRKVDWILVKAICDWADGNKGQGKDKRQKKAAWNVARFVLCALQFASIDWEKKRRSNPATGGAPSNSGSGAIGLDGSVAAGERGVAVGGSVRDIIINPSQATSTPSPSARFSLPAPPADFTGRQEQIDELTKQLTGGSRVAISGVAGMGGIGKTALALVVANQLASQYPDAQIYIELKGTSPTPLSPTEAMTQVIRAFEPLMDLRQVSKAEMEGTYRTLLSNKRTLLLLDNAADAAQVRPLLPPTSCALLLTSRRFFTLPGLTPLRLDILPETEACALLLKICPRIGNQAPRIANLCGCLPLALRIAASALGEYPDISPQEYLHKLADRRERIDVLKSESDPELDLRATFDCSYVLLPEELQAFWRELSVFPAPFDATAAAAVLAVKEESAHGVLSHLARVSLLDYDEATRRYSMHDLLAGFADGCLSTEERMTAQERHALHYVVVAAAANSLYLQGGEKVLAGLKLFDEEWKHIQAGQAWAAANARSGQSAAKLCSMYPDETAHCLLLRLHPRDLVAWLEAAATAAHQLSDHSAEGTHLGNLGLAYADLGEVRKAIGYHEQALAISRDIGDKRGEGRRLGNLGLAYADLGEAQKAIGYHERALAISREIGDRRGEADRLFNLSLAAERLEDPQKAINYAEAAWQIYQSIESPDTDGARQRFERLKGGKKRNREETQ